MLGEQVVVASRQSGARQPRTVVKINGTTLPTCVIEWTVVNNSFLEADTFTLHLAANRLPSAMNAFWFSEQLKDFFVEIFGGLAKSAVIPPSSALKSFIYGRVDTIEYEPVAQVITLTGRDLTGAFIDAKVSTQYQNQKSSQIATLLASAHGIDTSMITATKTPVGNYFAQDTMELTAGRSEWDLLAYLARQEGFVVDIIGKSLYFGADLTGTGSRLAVVYQLPSDVNGSPVANASAMSFTRVMTVAKGITVTVRSGPRWNPTTTQSYPVAARAITPGRSAPFGANTNYFFNMPAGATPQQCKAKAAQIYNEIIQHAGKAKFTLPADTTTDMTSSVVVTGTGTSWDQTYYPRLVTRTMHFEDGFSMEIEAQNTSPNMTPANDPSGTPPADESVPQDGGEGE